MSATSMRPALLVLRAGHAFLFFRTLPPCFSGGFMVIDPCQSGNPGKYLSTQVDLPIPVGGL
jgi:hypothetical protein